MRALSKRLQDLEEKLGTNEPMYEIKYRDGTTKVVCALGLYLECLNSELDGYEFSARLVSGTPLKYDPIFRHINIDPYSTDWTKGEIS